MKKKNLFVFTALTVLGLMLSACGATPASTSERTVGAKVDASLVFTGVVESIGEAEIVVDGQVVVLTPEMIVAADFVVGDTVEVEASVDETGAIVAEYVELHNEDDDDSFDDSMSLYGVVEGIDGNTVVIDGQTYTISNLTELDDMIAAGDTVSFEYIVNTDNTLSLLELELEDEDEDSSDDSSLTGVIEFVDGNMVTIDGQIYLLDEQTEFMGAFVAGDVVEFEYIVNADNTLSLTEIELEDDDSDDDMDDDSDDDMDDDGDDDMDDNGDDDDDDVDGEDDDDDADDDDDDDSDDDGSDESVS